MPMQRSLNHDFFKIWTPEMAYILGYFAADGSMLTNRRRAHFIEFTSTDRVLLEILQTVTGSDHRISERVVRNERWKPQYRLQIGSKEWFTDLTCLGFSQRKSKKLAFPEVPAPFMGDFIRGYFDGDGCVYLKQHWSKWHNREVWQFLTSFTSGCVDFLESLRAKLRQNGIQRGRVAHKERGYDLIYGRHDSLALYRLMYDTASVPLLFLPRKREKFERAIQVLGLDVRS